MTRICILILLIALAGCSATGKRGKEAETHYLLGVSYLQEQNHTLALQEFLRAEETEPRDPEIQAALGQAYQLKKAYDKAEDHYHRALKLRPGDPQIQNNLAALYLDMQRWDDAIRNFRLAADNLLFTRQAMSLTGIGYANYHKGDYPAAISALKEALASNPQNPQAYFLLGETYQALGRSDLAVVEYRQAIALNSEYSSAHYQLGLAYMKLGKKEKAAEAFREVLRISPGSEWGAKAADYLKLLH